MYGPTCQGAGDGPGSSVPSPSGPFRHFTDHSEGPPPTLLPLRTPYEAAGVPGFKGGLPETMRSGTEVVLHLTEVSKASPSGFGLGTTGEVETPRPT